MTSSNRVIRKVAIIMAANCASLAGEMFTWLELERSQWEQMCPYSSGSIGIVKSPSRVSLTLCARFMSSTDSQSFGLPLTKTLPSISPVDQRPVRSSSVKNSVIWAEMCLDLNILSSQFLVPTLSNVGTRATVVPATLSHTHLGSKIKVLLARPLELLGAALRAGGLDSRGNGIHMIQIVRTLREAQLLNIADSARPTTLRFVQARRSRNTTRRRGRLTAVGRHRARLCWDTWEGSRSGEMKTCFCAHEGQFYPTQDLAHGF